MLRSLRLAVVSLARDWRSGELGVLLLALTVAVAALTAVGFFTSRVNRGVAHQAGEVLAADLRLESGRPINPQYFRQARAAGLETAELASFPSVVLFQDTSGLSAVRAVSEGYPLRGKLKIAAAPFARGYVTDALPQLGEVWADARLLARLGAPVGASVRVGAKEFKVTQVLDYRPDQGSQFIDLAPSLLMRLQDLPATRLVQPGSRVNYTALFAGTPRQVAAFKSTLQSQRQTGERLTDVADASPQIQTATERASRFLNLAALVTILLAAVAVAIAARRYVARRLDTVALMKSMGASQRRVLEISLFELLLIGVLANVIGMVTGYLAQSGLAWLLKDLIRSELPAPDWDPAVLGLVTSALVLVGFALPALMQLKYVPPARVLRRNLEPPPLKYSVVSAAAVGAVIGILYWIVRDHFLVGVVIAAVIATFIILTTVGWLLVKSLQMLRTKVGVSWRYGIANIARRGGESVVQIVAFGLGIMVLLLLAVVRNDLLEEWRASLPATAANHFMFNIRADETEQVRYFFREHGLQEPMLVPMIRARLQAINGEPIREMKFTNDRARGFSNREANLTWLEQLPPDNKITSGTWWAAGDGGGPRVSVEAGIATALNLKLGDELTYDVAGELVSAKVASIREVQWETFRPNFFLVFSPGVLDDTAGTYLTSLYIPEDKRAALVQLVRRFPEITVIDVEAILTQVRSVMDKAALAVQSVFFFTLCAGVTVLLAAIQATREERRFESAMLRTLGARRGVVLQGVAAEFITLGVLSGVLAATGATIAGYFLATEAFNLEYNFNPLVWALGLVGGALLVGGSGILATRSVVNHPPIATLRRE